MKLLAIASLAIALGYAAATCPNLCNGHGTCGASDRCTCFGNWQGADCSERVCNYGLAWVDAPSATDTAHWYAECSNKGTCDRSTGLCDCYEGYTGKGCRRSTCPNDCSGHGTCYYIEELSSFGDKNVIDYGTMQTYSTWDKSKIQACVCDPYYEGNDCSLRQCPRGDNILTTGGANAVQRIRISDATLVLGTSKPTGEITITFKDLYGGVWETTPIQITGTVATDATSVQNAIMALPNQVAESVACVGSELDLDATAATDDTTQFDCTFSGDQNSGDQHDMIVNYKGCSQAGCTPIYTGLAGAASSNGITVTVTDETGTHKEAKVCSEHGICDTETGLCECFSGYYDEDCSKQTVLV
jgi:hypothetical protein